MVEGLSAQNEPWELCHPWEVPTNYYYDIPATQTAWLTK